MLTKDTRGHLPHATAQQFRHGDPEFLRQKPFYT